MTQPPAAVRLERLSSMVTNAGAARTPRPTTRSAPNAGGHDGREPRVVEPTSNPGVPMPRAIWNDQVIADAPETVMVEGNHYFPPGTVDERLVRASDTTTRCHWKGQASYVDLLVDDEVATDGAWYYPEPLDQATHITGHYAFGRDVTIEA
jgi:uncharacterized protein (DUF427 family)